MASCFIAALTCLCAVNVYLAANLSKKKLETLSECGRREPVSPRKLGKIVGGKDAEHGKYPWQVSLQLKTTNGSFHYCGGSILDKTTIITAAQCLIGIPIENVTLQVVAGEHTLSHDDGTEQTVEVFNFTIHRYFDTYSMENDIALLKLSTALDLSGKYAKSICLPSVLKEEPSGFATVTGWKTRLHGNLNETLQEVSVPIIADAKCRQYYDKHSILNSMLCAGYKEGGKDSCEDDSGGPLMVEGDDGIATLIGIVSWGIGCGQPKLPGVYTQVSYFLKWISKKRA